MKKLLTLVGVIAAAAVLVTTAGAGTGATPRIDLSTHSGAIKYLKSIGVDPKGVVIQRGLRNYAGPSCPGRGWSCTSSTRVFQLAATGGVNKFVCADTSGTATTPPTTSSTDPLNCVITQTATGASNVASCIEDESTVPSSMETCSITQTNTTGSNTASVNQKITQNVGASQNASQSSFIDQQNGSGANTAQVAQNINQSANAPGNQSQTASQSSCVNQHGTEFATGNPCSDDFGPPVATGADKSNVTQSVTQNESADRNSSEFQQDDISGHVSQQTQGLATSQNTQNEHQNEGGGNGSQTQLGPLVCCTEQGNNAGDKYNITQMADQNASSPNADQEDTLIGQCDTAGVCKVSQSVDEPGGKNNCTGPSCSIGLACSEGSCEPCTPGGEGGCFVCTESCGPGFLTFRTESRMIALAAQRLLMRLH